MNLIWHHRRLLKELVRRDLRTRYKVSVLGFFWSLLRPLMSMAIIAVIFTYVVEIPHDSFPHVHYFAFLLCGYLPWTLITGSVVEGTQSLLANAQLIKKVACPRMIFPLAVVLSNLINTLLAFVVLLPMTYLVFHISAPLSCVWLVPLLIGETLLAVGLVWGLSALNVLYRDVTQILEFVMLAWFYATPIIYSVDLPFGRLELLGFPTWLYMLNPMATLVYASRRACLGTAENAGWVMSNFTFGIGIILFIVFSIGVLIAGQALFRRLETRAVDAL
ncbi:MAG: ABC transporter permease [bacterium]